MTTDSSAIAPEQTPHEIETTTIPIGDATRRRAQAVISDRSIDPEWRTIIRYALEINDPWLPDLVNRAEAGEDIVDTFESWHTSDDEDHSTEEKIKALAEVICRAGDECAAALFVLMGTLENSSDPQVLASTSKHFAFNRCAELNLYGIVDAQLAIVERELLAGNDLS